MKHLFLTISLVLSKFHCVFCFVTINVNKKNVEITNNHKDNSKALQASSGAQIIYQPALMGKMSSFFSTLAINPRKLRVIKAGLKNEIVILDIIALIFFNWSVKPLTKVVYYKLLHKHDYFKRDYDTSIFSIASDLSSKISKIASLIYLIDVFDIILTGVSLCYDFYVILLNCNYSLGQMGFKFAIKYELGKMAGTIFYTVSYNQAIENLSC